jgi:ribosomal protein L1
MTDAQAKAFNNISAMVEQHRQEIAQLKENYRIAVDEIERNYKAKCAEDVKTLELLRKLS